MLAYEPEAAPFLRIILGADEALVGAPTAFEYLMVAKGERSAPFAEQIERVLNFPRIRIVAWTAPLAEIAQTAFLTFGKGRHAARLNYGDCMSYALAKSHGCPLLYKGDDFAKTDIARAA